MSRDQFDELGEDYYRIKGGHVHLYYTRQKVDVLNAFVREGSRCLDVGCGSGLHSRLLRDGKYCQPFGLDRSEGMVKSANRSLGSSFAVRGSAVSLPYKDSAFDVVFMVNVLHHLIEPGLVAQAIGEMARVSKKYVVIFEFNPLNPFCRYVLFKVCPYDSGNERIPPAREVVRSAQKNGLAVEAIKHKSFMPMYCPRALMPFFSRLEALLERMIPWASVGMAYIFIKNDAGPAPAHKK